MSLPPVLRPLPAWPVGGTLLAFVSLVWSSLLVLVPARTLVADGGTLRVSNAPVGAYRVNVFTAPTPIPPDSVDVSVLVTFDRNRELVPGLEIMVTGEALEGQAPSVSHPASKAEAQDPRYYAAKFALGAVGSWEITVHIRGPEGEGEVSFRVEAQEPGLLANPFLILTVALVPLVLVGLWLKKSGGPPVPPADADESQAGALP